MFLIYLLSKCYFFAQTVLSSSSILIGICFKTFWDMANLSSAVNVNAVSFYSFFSIYFGSSVLIKGQNGHGDSGVC